MARKSIIIILNLSELLYDVYNKTYLTGKSRADGDNFVQVALMQATEDEESKNQILRSITNAFAEVKRVVGEYLYEGCDLASNSLTADPTIELCLLVPDNFNVSAKDNIALAIHQYIVNTAIYDWFIITNKEDASSYLSQANDNAANIRESLQQRVRPQKP